MVKFINYDGKYPCLCYGVLTVEIDGKKYDLDNILISGGFTDWQADIVGKGPWEIREDKLPDEIKKYAQEILKEVNANVPLGCCGGCI